MDNDVWASDHLNRRDDGEHLIRLLRSRYEARKASTGSGSYILNIDAAWGEGKTFFLDCIGHQLQSEGHLVARVNAWRDDHADDPLITVMAAIEDVISPHFSNVSVARTAWEKGKKAMGAVAAEASKQIALHAIKAATGISVGKLIEAYSGGTEVLDEDKFGKAADKVWEKSLDKLVGERVTDHKRANDAIAEFRLQTGNSIAALAEKGVPLPVFVFVDELDRCRPTYAIRLLEDMKHMFEVEGLVFVVATDSQQLSHSVKAIYGSEFESRKYLRRFFDAVFVFPEVDRMKFIKSLFERHGLRQESFFMFGNAVPEFHIRMWADAFKLSNRDLVQVFEIISTFVTSYEHPIQIEPNYLLALCWAHYSSNENLWRSLSVEGDPRVHLVGWQIMADQLDHHGNSSSHLTAAGELLLTTRSELRNNFTHLLDNKNSRYYRYFQNEWQSRANINSERSFSILREYPSRVRNAGRVLDDTRDR